RRRSRAAQRLLPHLRRHRRGEPADRVLPAQTGTIRLHRLRPRPRFHRWMQRDCRQRYGTRRSPSKSVAAHRVFRRRRPDEDRHGQLRIAERRCPRRPRHQTAGQEHEPEQWKQRHQRRGKQRPPTLHRQTADLQRLQPHLWHRGRPLMSVHVITASAGSGKTFRLTELLSGRLTNQPTDGTAPLRASEVIATTFTVRAAADLVEKTQKRLLDDGNITAADEIGTALIGTINSVSGRLVTDYAIDAGYSPELRVLDEAEQATVFTAAVDDVIADAEATHRDLLLRTGHNGSPDDANPFGHGPVVWSDLVKAVAEAARANHLGEAQLRESAEASVELFLSALPSSRADGRQAWRDCLAGDIDELRTALRYATGDEPDATAAPPIAIDKRSAGNVEGSIITLDRFLRDLDGRADDDAPFARIPWATSSKIAEVKYPQAPGGKAPGKVPKQVLGSSSGALVADELLANSAFHADVEALIRLIIDTAIASLDAYEEHKNRLGVMDFVDQE